MSRRGRVILWVFATVLLVGGGLAWAWNVRDVQVEVANVGTVPLTEVVVRTRGNDYELGTLEPGTRTKVHVSARGESHVEVEWKTPDRIAHRHVVDCYFVGGWPTYHGTVVAEIDRSAVVRTDGRFRPGP